jgi:cephalosporin hydroxylase
VKDRDPDPPLLENALDMTLREWIERYQRDTVFTRVTYRGIPAWKNVLDLWVYQELIWQSKATCIVEIGVRHGGTTLWLSDLLASFYGDEGIVIAIDLARPKVELPQNVHFIEADSIAAETVATVKDICAAKRTMVIADGNHEAEHVLAELRAYSPIVSEGSYFIAEDGIVDVMDWREFTPGPAVAAERFVAENGAFVIDREPEKFVLTYAPKGFVKRVRAAGSR